jgi:methionyl aminopeptidase
MNSNSEVFRNGMRAAGKLAAAALDYVEAKIHPGATTLQLERYCMDYIERQGGKSGCHGYKGYPGYVCISPNEVVCHGIPGDRVLVEGDIVNIDIVVELDGFYGDTARMFCVGSVKKEARDLIEVTREARDAGIKMVRAGATTGDIGYAIQSYVANTPFEIIKEYCGHGIGKQMHMPPLVRNYGEPGQGIKLQEGMCITVEPIVAISTDQVKELDDGWTVVTADGSWAAQCEHTVYVTRDGYEILT